MAIMKLWLFIDGVVELLLCSVVVANPAQPTLVTLTLDFQNGQTLQIDQVPVSPATPYGFQMSMGPATGKGNQVFLLQGDFACITPLGVAPTSKAFGFKIVPFAAA